jgi:outer membrane protein assembly factor BamB
VGYRDPLDAAHQRIVQLEAELRGRPPPASPRRWPRTLARVVASLFVFSVVGMGVAVLRARPSAPVAATWAPTVIEQKAVADVQWYPQRSVGPLFEDVNLDRVDDLIALFWSPPLFEATPSGLYVVALDGATFKPLWWSGPYPGQWASERTHLVLSEGKLLLTDTQSRAHVLDARTGVKLAAYELPDAPIEACTGGGTGFIVTLETRTEPKSFDPGTGVLEPAPHAGCPVDGMDWCTAGLDEPCLLSDGPAAFPGRPAAREFLTLDFGKRSGDDRVALYRGGDAELLFGGWQRKDYQLRWTASAALDGDVIHYPRRPLFDVRDGRLIVSYPTKAGPFRLRMIDAKTGTAGWNATVPDTAEGSVLESMRVHAGRVYLVVDQKLHVFDAATGALVKAVHSVILTK